MCYNDRLLQVNIVITWQKNVYLRIYNSYACENNVVGLVVLNFTN